MRRDSLRRHSVTARFPRTIAIVAVVLLQTALAVAQPPPPPTPQPPPAAPATTTPTTTPESNIPQIDDVHSDRQELTNGQKTQHHIGHVELVTGDMTIYADDAWYYTDEHRFVATGNVVFAQGQNRITAEKAEFDTNTRLGTFYTAWGVAPVKPPPQRSGGFVPPQLSGNQDATVIFFGETIKKVGPKKYEILKGGFTTCLQPTPRWDLLADKITLNIDHYTLMRDAVLSVKGVPMFYLPVLYYPTKREGRATGFLIPTYGQSSLRGQSIHNAFFWAIDRSQDATLLHDWFSKTGQGVGGEYRYNYAPTGDGTLRAYLLDQHEAVYPQADGTSRVSPASRSYEIRGGSNQALPGRIRARASVEYFSSIVTSQTFNTNVYDATRNQRSFGGNLIGAWSSYSLNGTFDHREYFYDPTNSVLSGSWPRVALTRNEKPLFGSPIYFQFSTEYAHFLRDQRIATGDLDSSLNRFDISPQIRFPFKKWQWFTVNTTANWRDTYYSRSQDAVTRKVLDEDLNRRVYTLQSQIVGPVFNRIWDTPHNGYAEKFKHAVEPFLGIQRTSSVENFRQIISFDGIDSYVGGTRYTYGLSNRIYAKVRQNPGQTAQSREIVGVEVAQSYYTNQGAAQYDRQYQTQTGNEAPTHFSPIALSFRAFPTNDLNGTLRAEFDPRYHALRTVSAQGSYQWSNRVQVNGGWSKKSFIAELIGFNDPAFLDHYVNGSTNVHTRDNRVGSVYSFNYDVLRSNVQQQRVSAYYNAQCCGLAFEFQTYNFGNASLSPIPADHRFFLSFTLAGLGNFSPFNGALGGVPR
jgi:LPS-assembly protein